MSGDTSGDGGRAFVEARGISKRFGAVQALDAVDLEVRPGEVLALAGENGSGKSTLARVLAGVLPPDKGEVAVDGEVRRFTRPRDALEAGIALVSQELTAVPFMSIGENIMLPTLSGVTALVRQRRLAEQARPYLERVGLRVDPSLPFVALGPGDRELAEVAKALVTSPRLLVLDEATTRLPDPERLFVLVERLCEDGMAAILITHRLREIRRLAHRAVVLRDGRLVGDLEAHELDDRRISSMMVGRELHGYHHKTQPRPGAVALRVEGVLPHDHGGPATIEVRQGEIVGVAGLVGSGRSALLERVAGARPRGGRVFVHGREVPAGSTRAAMRAGMTLLPEDRLTQGLMLTQSVRANVAMSSWRSTSVVHRQREQAIADKAVADLSIRCRDVETEVRTLSGGNQQKVVIARCLTGEPTVLLLDEPTRGVDVGAREEIYKIIADMIERSLAVLMTSSDLPELLGLADRVIVLHEGAVAGELERADATEERIALLAAGGTEVEHVA